MTERRDKTWAECWEIVRDLSYFPCADSAIRDLEARRLNDYDIVRIFLLSLGVAIGCLTMVGTVFWITWRALLWSLGQL